MSLIIAIPSKGRLKQDTMDVFAKAGLTIVPPADERSYQTTVEGRDDIEIAFLSASEIAGELAAGSVHLGVTGEDLAREKIAGVDEAVSFVAPLGFGHADVVVAVPDAWIDVDTMADLDDVAAHYRQRTGRRLRVATKYWQLTQNWFGQHGIGVYRIVESLGATEGAPAAGSADAIVDITSTGSTIRANNLKVLDDGVILKSQATLIESKRADWGHAAKAARDDVVAKVLASLGG
ncbi:ATP phosphoribosyltransferase [Ahrensia sp. R2A130]|uniref:ATP phosphoribosyltransferase n=1 Tax=Ahrensia sp. R2A130 TaxID=744979 RepID=UPI0001E09461|nr:ATP phosphoribosyltransferase [Ahrensia sp. R2A130]EFL88542.1 ATP phosphoribosyltransferase [Ahrensia sp. R2A130]